MIQDADQILRIDLSDKTPAEISDFFIALLAAKRTLAQQAINIHICPKTRRIKLNKKTPQDDFCPARFLGFTTTEDGV